MPDSVKHPAHYQLPSGREVIDVIREVTDASGFVAYCKGNVIKYVCRAGMKGTDGGAEDFRKAARYCEFAAEQIEQSRTGTFRCLGCERFTLMDKYDLRGSGRCEVTGKYHGPTTIACEDFMPRGLEIR